MFIPALSICSPSVLHWISILFIHSIQSCSCSTCCVGLGFQLQNLQDFIKISRALIKDIFLTHMAPPRPGRGRHPLQHVRTRQYEQARAPLLSAPPLLPHTGAPNTNPHMPRPNLRHSLHPPLHLVLPHTRTAGAGTHSHVPPSETYHLQRKRGVRHPHPAAHNPSSPPRHGPRHIRLPAHEPMPPHTTITCGTALLHRRLRRICPHAHHRGGHPAADPHRGTLPH